MHEFTFSDIFAGIGGFRLGFEQAGFKNVFAIENNIHCINTYKANFNEIPLGDITAIDINALPKHAVLTAGFPCQPFSISGHKKGFNDTRGTLIYHVFKIIDKLQPEVVLLENVKHLKHHDKGRTLSIILDSLSKMNYTISWDILNASDFGLPHNRERLIIIASLNKIVFDFSKLKKLPRPRLKNFLDSDKSKHEYLDETYTLIDNPRAQKSGLIFIGYRNKKIRKAGVRPNTNHLSRVHKQPNRIYSAEGIHPTLPSTETTGRFWILNNDKVRKLTINECFRIMGFPCDYKKVSSLTELYKQIGNSVAVPMVKEIAIQIKSQLL